MTTFRLPPSEAEKGSAQPERTPGVEDANPTRTWPDVQGTPARFRLASRKVWLAACVALIIASLMLLRHLGLIDADSMVDSLKRHPTLAPFLFVLVYAVMVFALLPTLPMNLAAGFLWGPYLGTLYTVFGATLGAVAAFLTARYLLRDQVLRFVRGRARAWLSAELAGPGWKTVAFTRVNPVFPFGPVNWVFGVSSIRAWAYTWATLVFVVPPAMFIASIGASVGSLVLSGETRSLVTEVMTASALVTALAIGMPLLRKYLSRQT